ncbi:Lsr2 family protein [Kribbella sp. NBC_01245]|uniref:histone-like nucleoid-structuring protein Lsr2 n=1 Tax=Kribbella sp. NBC_01245 TaxID=2903578 RepID=UPI002E27E881|nr:Lsr2 family protein [Kribbella sp. NBC_01245]
MAQKIQVLLEDDLDGGKADETVTFGLDGTTFEIDLSKKNAAKLRDALAAYVGAGRRVSGRRGAAAGRGARGRGRSATDSADIRAWAKENGYEVSERGRISAEVRAAYNEAK